MLYPIDFDFDFDFDLIQEQHDPPTKPNNSDRFLS